MHSAMRYDPRPPGGVRYIGAVEEYDIYVSSGGINYIVRWGNGATGRRCMHPVRNGVPEESAIKGSLTAHGRTFDDDVPLRISLMISLFGQP